jgi:hypothetical protein
MSLWRLAKSAARMDGAMIWDMKSELGLKDRKAISDENSS